MLLYSLSKTNYVHFPNPLGSVRSWLPDKSKSFSLSNFPTSLMSESMLLESLSSSKDLKEYRVAGTSPLSWQSDSDSDFR